MPKSESSVHCLISALSVKLSFCSLMGKIGGIKTPVWLLVELKTVHTENWACAMGLTSHECKPPTRKCHCFMTMKISAIPYFKETIVK